MEKKISGKLHNWQIIDGQVYGDIYADHRWPDGEAIHTSRIVKITVETKNSIYELEPELQASLGLTRYVGRGA